MFWIVVTLVFLNTSVMATEHHNQPDWLGNFQVTYSSVSLYFHPTLIEPSARRLRRKYWDGLYINTTSQVGLENSQVELINRTITTKPY